MSKPGITPDGRMRRKPLTRNISMRSVVHHVAGQEQPYPTLRFSDRIYVDLPNHNPFKTSEPPGFTLIEDDFAGRVLMDDEPQTQWRAIQLPSYPLPLLISGQADITNSSYLAAAIRDDVNSSNHFVEMEIDWQQVGDFYNGPWCWVRADSSASAGGDSGWYGVMSAGDLNFGTPPVDDTIFMSIVRWDAPNTYTFEANYESHGSQVIPPGTLMRLTADGRDLTLTLDLGGTGEIDHSITHRVPADDPYLTNTGVGFGSDNYYQGQGPIESVKIGLP